ncbi:hypothetical protein L618_002900000080 [Rhodococcus rhodochrous J45]|uniref:Uncharacterized protein n=1 Tax=Rhodococcus rhodochrous J45 TaxID=935266 RepID=A0A562E238_RHORH|nr:hypothetical protein L618_002900000080 [Rhodococcus rhodochrous J45]
MLNVSLVGNPPDEELGHRCYDAVIGDAECVQCGLQLSEVG